MRDGPSFEGINEHDDEPIESIELLIFIAVWHTENDDSREWAILLLSQTRSWARVSKTGENGIMGSRVQRHTMCAGLWAGFCRAAETETVCQQ